ncbi:MAG TPA: UvrD-helicase domain-containing protein [Gemmatimonadaceae bacterium]|nr:UvrD-helicase domain-containing protein [Gemmatimonadaceae bacterium]
MTDAATLLEDPRLLAGLNAAQRAAVLHTDGPLLVLAGAGSGKTRVLTTRIARLVEVHGVAPGEVLAVTFTNKAAGEMRERIERLLGRPASGMWVGTFHAIGARLLRATPQPVARTAAFTIYDQDDSLSVIKRLMERQGVSPREYAPRAVQAAISDAKNALVSPAEYERLAMDPFARTVAPLYHALEDALRVANAVDFDDLLVLPVRLLQQNPALLARYRARFRYLLVDEYQDTNRAQYALVQLLGGGHGNVCVVGDDDQSIYGWRGADLRNILDFSKDFPAAAVVRLEENYRSAPPILDVANVVIRQNAGRMGKTLRPTRAGGEAVTATRALDERDEADWVVQELLTRRAAENRALREFAILYRTNAQSRALEDALRRQALPYRLLGAVRFYDRREIRDVMSYLKLIANPADDEAFRRAVSVPKRGLGETTIEQLAAAARGQGISLYAAAERPDVLEAVRPAARSALAQFAALVASFRAQAREAAVDELLRDLLDAIRYGDYLRAEGPESAERLDNVRELIAGAAEVVADELGEVGLTPLDHFLQRAALVAGADALDPEADAVTLMTLHNAKGLEFPVVFITGLEDGLFPLARAYDEPGLLEEERRLFYVGITRAEGKLYLTHAEERRRNGELTASRPSSFLLEIPEGMLETRSTVKVRSSGRAVMRGGTGGYGQRGHRWGDRQAYRPGAGSSADSTDGGFPASAAARRPGRPVEQEPAFQDDENASQAAAVIAVGARVRHRKFGAGTIAELTGAGREIKAKVDFDDESIGRKTLVVAQANLEREIEA